MKYLLDTHTALWTISNPGLLGKKSRGIIEDSLNDLYVSSLSLWEISLKARLGKLIIMGFEIKQIPDLLDNMDIKILDFSGEDAIGFIDLDRKEHKDPFELALIYLSVKYSYTLISKDKRILEAKMKGLKAIW